ncbi:MAG: HPr family phosphocarrier protein [Hungatella hathewayi]|nr:HPr family phosphocarrier protein [Hungatella hathewayi]
MVEWEYTIQDPEGLHARPASKLVMKAMKFSSDIRVSLYQNSADAKNILEVMALGAGRNDKILVRAAGEDEEEALEAVKQVLAQENDLNP